MLSNVNKLWAQLLLFHLTVKGAHRVPGCETPLTIWSEKVGESQLEKIREIIKETLKSFYELCTAGF